MDKIPFESGNVLNFDLQTHRVHGLFRWLQGRTLAALIFALSFLVLYEPAQAQVNPEIASCSELKDEGTAFQADICSAHIGCRFVMSIQKTCTNIKSYLNRLKAAIGDGVGSLSGGNRYEITPDAVYSAVEGESKRSLPNSKFNANPEALRGSQEIRERVKKVGQGETLTGSYADGTKYVYYGEVKEGQPEGFGTLIKSNGLVARGQRNANGANGQMEILTNDGSRLINEYKNGILSGPGFQAFVDGSTIAGNFSGRNENGTVTFANGVRFEGSKVNGKFVQGRVFRADGTLAEEGSYENNVLSVGTKYDSAGGRTEINLPRERQLAEMQRQRNDAVAAEQRRSEQRQTLPQTNASTPFNSHSKLSGIGSVSQGLRLTPNGTILLPPKGYEQIKPAQLYSISIDALGQPQWIVARSKTEAIQIGERMYGFYDKFNACMAQNCNGADQIAFDFGWVAIIQAFRPGDPNQRGDTRKFGVYGAHAAPSREAAINGALAEYRAKRGNNGPIAQSLRVGLVSELDWPKIEANFKDLAKKHRGSSIPSMDKLNYSTFCDWADKSVNLNPEPTTGDLDNDPKCKTFYRPDEKLPPPVLLVK